MHIYLITELCAFKHVINLHNDLEELSNRIQSHFVGWIVFCNGTQRPQTERSNRSQGLESEKTLRPTKEKRKMF